MRNALFMIAILAFCSGAAYAQASLVPAPPVQIDLGIGGGVTLPSGTLSDADNTGWHAGAKVRFHGFMPLNIVASGAYHRLPNKIGSESDTETMLSAGLEYPIPSVMVKPYFGLDGSVNILGSTIAGSQSVTREGLGVGVGVEFSVPAFGSFDTSIKYQMLNLMGKNSNEDTISQIAANVSIMFNVM